MKLRTKMFFLFASLTLLTSGGLTVYTTIKQQNLYVQNELASQRQLIGLLNNSVLSQYFAYINQQIISVLNTRGELREQGKILEHYVSKHAQKDDYALLQYLKAQQDSFNQVKKDLIVVKDHLLLLSPTYKDILSGSSVSGQTLLTAMRSTGINVADGYYLGIFNKDKHKSNYLSYSFPLAFNSSYKISIIQNIDDLLAFYSVENGLILPQLKESFESMRNNLSDTTAVVINAKDGKVLLSSDDKENLLPFDLKSLLLQEHLEQNMELEDRQGKKYYACASYFKPLDWYLIIYRSEDEIIAPAIEQAKVNLLIGFLILILTVIVTVLLSRKLTSALNLIARKADQIALLNLSDPRAIACSVADLDAKGGDEVSKVSRAIKLMGQSVSDNLQKLIAANQQKDRMQGELKAASEIQEGMLPKKEDLLQTSYFSCAAYLLPAKEVGGDFYDVIRLNEDEVALIIGDVSDKGVPAALFMSTAISLARCALGLGFPPQKTMELINNRLSERNPNMMFVTMYIMILNEKNGHFRACNAGHCFPVVIGRAGAKELNTVSGPAVGPLPEMSYSEYEGNLEINETVLLYTDGVSEAQNKRLEFFGTAQVLKLCSSLYGDNCEDCLKSIVSAVHNFRGDYIQTDDITLLCFKRH